MSKIFEAAIFDLDGTLTDTEPFHRQAWQIILSKYGLELTEETYYKKIAGRATLLVITQEFGFHESQAESFYQEIQAASWEVSEGRFQPLPGLLPFL